MRGVKRYAAMGYGQSGGGRYGGRPFSSLHPGETEAGRKVNGGSLLPICHSERSEESVNTDLYIQDPSTSSG